jgi:NAD-specific glutamate dehydrogenase
VRDTGRDVLDVVRAWAAAVRISGAAAVREQLAAARDRLRAEAEQRAALALAGALERAARWLVQTQPAGAGVAELIARFREPVMALLASWPDQLTADQRGSHQAAVADLVDAGVDTGLAQGLVSLGRANEALEIVQVAHLAAAPVAVAAEAYGLTAALVDLDWIRAVLPSALPGEDRWEPRAVASLLEVLLDLRRQLTLSVLGHRQGGAPIAECLRAYATTCQEQLDVVNGLLTDLKAAAPPTLPALLVLIREVGRLVRPLDCGRAW